MDDKSANITPHVNVNHKQVCSQSYARNVSIKGLPQIKLDHVIKILSYSEMLVRFSAIQPLYVTIELCRGFPQSY